MIQINPLQSYIDGGARAALTTPPSASLVFDLPGKAIWVKGVKLKGIDHTYTFSHDNYITLTNTPDKNNPESEDINIGVNITTLKNAIDTTYNGGTLALLQEGLNTEERTWQAKILHSYINNVLPTTKNLQINGTNYAIYTTEDSLPQFFAPVSLGTTGQILACTSSGLSWINQIQNTDYRVSQSSATNDNDYRIILKQGADNNPETNFVRFSEYLTFNPSTKTLKINNIKVVTATDIYIGATSTANATAGLVPAATSEQQNYYLRGDGTWVNIATEMATVNTWRPIKVENTDALGSSTDTGTLSFTAGTGITLAWDATNKRIIITNSSPDQNHNTDETVRQVPKTDNVNRPLMMINGSTSAGEQINTSMFSTGIYANASTKIITANGFIKAGSSDSYVLLGGGGHKTISSIITSGYIGTTQIQTSSMEQALSGISSINRRLTISTESDLTRLGFGGVHNVVFGEPGYAHRIYYFRPSYGASGYTLTSVHIQNASASNSPIWTTTHTFDYNGNAYHQKHLAIGANLSTYDENRAELDLVSETDVPNDLWFGSNKTRHWCFSSRGSSNGNYIMLYTPDLGAIMTALKTNGNIGIGTTAPVYKLEVAGNICGSVLHANRNASGTEGGVSLYGDVDPITYGITFRDTGNYGKIGKVQGDWATYFTMNSSYNRGWIFRSGGINYASISTRGEAYFNAVGTDNYIAYPSGGFFSSKGSTGYIIITIPANYKSCTMMRFNVEIYNYSRGTSTTYTIGGYNFYDGNWYNVFAYANRQGTTEYGNLTVRFGHNGTNSIIWIGESNTSYSYPEVRITNVTLGHYSIDYNTWASGWSITINTTEPTNVSQTVINPATNYYAQNAGNADTIDGYHASAFAATSHTHPYLPLTGGTMTGTIKFNGTSLPQKTLQYVCGIDAFASGGEMGWMSGSEFVEQYAPTKIGTGASGTWDINITGNADTVDDYHASALITWKDMVSERGALTWSEEKSGVTIYSHYTGHGLGQYRAVLACKAPSNSIGLEINAYWCVNSYDSAAANNIYYRVKRDAESDWGPYTKLLQSDGNATITGSYYANSDIRYKSIQIYLLNKVNSIAELPIFTYYWKDNQHDDKLHIGSSAQAVNEIFPELVTYDEQRDFYNLDYATLGTIAGITACKELVTQKSELQELKEKVKQLEDKLCKYENTL